jgi:hypothetical protein
MMGSRANGKDPFFDSGNEEKHPGDVDGEISLLDDDHDDGGGEDKEESSTSPYMTHGVYNNAGSLSVMLEVTIEDGKVYDFYEALSTCYDGYVPTHLPGSVPFEFPHATKSYVEPKAEEKRLMAAKAFEEGPLRLIENFIRERGHGAIANENQCCLDGPIDPRLVLLSRRIRHSFQTGVLNPHIKELCDHQGIVVDGGSHGRDDGRVLPRRGRHQRHSTKPKRLETSRKRTNINNISKLPKATKIRIRKLYKLQTKDY